MPGNLVLEPDHLWCYTIRMVSGMALAPVHFYSPIKLLGMNQLSASSVLFYVAGLIYSLFPHIVLLAFPVPQKKI